MRGATIKDIVLLDSNSSKTVFCNEEYAENIKESETILELEINNSRLASTKKYEILYLSEY